MENSFPLGIFPQKIRSIVEDVSAERQYPLDYLASVVLWAISVLVGACARLKTTLGTTYASIYLMLVGVQGANKSAPMAWATKYLHELDHEALNQYEKAVKEYEEAISQGEKTTKPTCKRYLTDASTPEALVKILRENPKGIGQCSDEIAKAFKDTGRYANTNDEEIYLRLFNGDTMTVDRATRQDVLHVSNPFFCLAGTIQPATFHRIFNHIRVENGLLARFIEAVHFEEEALLWNLTEDLPSNADHRYQEIINLMIEWRDSIDVECPQEYTLSDLAAETIQEWQNKNELKIATSGKEIDRAVFRKIQLYVLKFALLIQVSKDIFTEGAHNGQIDFASATYATIIADYYFKNAKDLAHSVYVRALSAREKRVYEALPLEFSSEQGLIIARANGLGKSCYYDFLSKIRGILIDQPTRGKYVKREEMNI